MGQNRNNVRTDRFGNPTELKRMYRAVNKKTGEEVEGAYVTYFEIAGKRYKIETSPCTTQKEGKPHQRWAKVTRIQKRSTHSSL